MALENDKIKEVLNGMLGSIEQDNIDLYSKLIEERGNMKIDDCESFYFSLIYPHSKFLKGLIRSEICKNDKVDFLLLHSRFVENHFLKLIVEKEGSACSADKSRTIINRIFKFLKTGEKIEWNYEGEYTFHLPKKLFKTHDEIIDFYEAVKHVYYGNYKQYIEALKNVLQSGA